MSVDTTCSAHWSNPGSSSDCSVVVDYHVPTDCFKGIQCSTEAFVSSGPSPTSQTRAELTKFDGNNLLGVDNTYTIGGPCDPGYVRPAAPPTPTISGDPEASCTTSWVDSDPNDCKVNIEIKTPADITKNITCDTKVIETLAP
jgi:hypothetical protein